MSMEAVFNIKAHKSQSWFTTLKLVKTSKACWYLTTFFK